MLILPGFISDTIGFLMLIPFTRKILINFWLRNKYRNNTGDGAEVIDAEIIEEKKDKNEL